MLTIESPVRCPVTPTATAEALHVDQCRAPHDILGAPPAPDTRSIRDLLTDPDSGPVVLRAVALQCHYSLLGVAMPPLNDDLWHNLLGHRASVEKALREEDDDALRTLRTVALRKLADEPLRPAPVRTLGTSEILSVILPREPSTYPSIRALLDVSAYAAVHPDPAYAAIACLLILCRDLPLYVWSKDPDADVQETYAVTLLAVRTAYANMLYGYARRTEPDAVPDAFGTSLAYASRTKYLRENT